MSTPSTPPDVLATMNTDGSRRWLKPRPAVGKTFQQRRWVAYGLIALFVALPFIRVEGTPVFIFELAKREFHIFGGTFYADDVALLTLFLLSTFIGIFLLTAILGRVWCGWGCPQTVYMEWVYRPIERLFDGKGRSKQRGYQIAKYVTYAGISLALSHIFLGYFVRIEELALWMTDSPAAHPGAFILVMAVSGLIFFDFAYFREQMCVIICPYARLQSALLDKKSLIIAYDKKRGEPRTMLKVLNDSPAGAAAGACIDCNACVTTCPTGIDIRNGLQLECIACAQCADACDAIMTKVGRPVGLIRYSTKDEMDETPRKGGLRPRLIVYPALLSVFVGLLVLQLWRRTPAEAIVLRAPGVPFMETQGGMVANSVRVRIRNRGNEARDYRLAIVPGSGVQLTTSENPVHLGPGSMRAIDVILEAPRETFEHGEPRYTLEISDAQDPARYSTKKSDRLLGPTKGRRHDEHRDDEHRDEEHHEPRN
jgi:cytochrome c oxidase accessory protein FixG